MKLSIIIPVYNIEHYISRCLESCIKQDLCADDYEIIVVNDGTPDHSIEIVNKIRTNTTSCGGIDIRVVNKENGGLSAARNSGLKEARGDYVWFVDGDDWIEAFVLGDLIDRVYKESLDILCFRLQLVFPDGHLEQYYVPSEGHEKVYEGSDFIRKVEMPPAAWCAIYSRRFLEENALSFYEGIIHEDQEFTPRAYYLARRISYVDKVVYNYFQREGGIMKSPQNEQKCKDLLTVADSLYRFILDNQSRMNQDAFWIMMNHVSFAVSQSLTKYSKIYFGLEEYRKKPYYPLCINPLLSMRDRVKYRLINFSLRLYLLIYQLK